MKFTNSPYEMLMQEKPKAHTPTPMQAPKGTPCEGCPYWRGIACLFCYRKALKKEG